MTAETETCSKAAADGMTPTLTVLYDGACPVCRSEIGVYRGLRPLQPIAFTDISEGGSSLPAGTTREQLLARFHVRHADGRLESGALAFLALWAQLPGWRWLAKIGAIPGMKFLMEMTYRLFLLIRPIFRSVSVFVVTVTLGLSTLSSGSGAQAAVVFSPETSKSCVAAAAKKSPSLSGYAVLDCVGRSAQACMSRPGGDTTIGMIDCLQGERDYWDGRLNAAYAKKMAAAKKEDAEMKSIRATTASLAEALRNMQRAWISHRDAACLYEQAQWLGGTGGGPATMACHMHETARQALKLEGWWSQ